MPAGSRVHGSGAIMRPVLLKILSKRVLVSGLAVTVSIGGIAVAILGVAEPHYLSFRAVLALNIAYGGFVAAVVSPIALLAALESPL